MDLGRNRARSRGIMRASMRAIASFLFALILPLQVSFAVAAEYCESWQADNGHHFGHHEHAKGSGHADPAGKKFPGDAGCGFCHLGCAHAQPSAFCLGIEAQAGVPASFDPRIPAGLSPPGIDRPPRSAIA